MPENTPKVETSAAARRLLKSRAETRFQLAVGGLKAVKKPNSTFESFGCVGYQPQQKRLEAVVFVHEPLGYNGDVCSDGSLEYVRFYISYDDGATWIDEGVSAFTAYNIADASGRARLEYAASLEIKPKRRFCTRRNVAKVRAILSWNAEPPANTPDHVPHWGDIHDTYIQVEPFKIFKVKDLISELDIKIPDGLTQTIDLSAEINVAEPKELSALELKKIYKNKVEPHRFALKEMHQFVQQSSSSAVFLPPDQPGLFQQLDVNIEDILVLVTGDGNTSYEELECVGLNPRQDRLAGVVRIKRPNGFSGGPCTKGSTEYVAFWADFKDNGTWNYVGTAEVNVHDINKIPEEGLEYAVSLPVDLSKYRRPCEDGPTVVKVRAILSWNIAPPPFNPNYVPVWGNREETLVHIYPGPSLPPGPSAVMSIVGGIPITMINNAGVTTNSAVFALNGLPADNLGRPCPFGARVVVQGPQFPGFKYRVQTREFDPITGWSGWSTVKTKFIVVNQFGVVSSILPDPATGMVSYLNFVDNINNTLGWWNSATDDLAEVKLDLFDNAGNPIPGALPAVQRVQLDNTGPSASVDIQTGPGNCGKFQIGATLQGQFVARDAYFGSYSLVVKPGGVNPPGVGVPSPSAGTVQTAVAPGDNWTLATAGMKPCGYVIEVHAIDRAIVNSIASRHHAGDSAGFCLE